MIHFVLSGAWWAVCTIAKIVASVLVITAAIGHLSMGHTFFALFLIVGLIAAHVLMHSWATWRTVF